MSDNTITQREYYHEIASIAQECLREQYEDGREVSECVSEAVDGHQWVIYTWANIAVLQISRNDNAYFENFGSLQAESFSDAVQKMAYAAMEADVQEALDEQDGKMVRTWTVKFDSLTWMEPSDKLPTGDVTVTVGGIEANNDIDSEDKAIDAAVDQLQELHKVQIEDSDTDVTLKITFERE